jgi:hypothetical protein
VNRGEYTPTLKIIMEFFKYLSDKILLWFLKSCSGFGKQLTGEGYEEQKLWREQRLRNLKGLSMRAKERYAEKAKRAQLG